MKNQLIIYDGVCLLCNAFVRFIIKHDKKDLFRFTPYQFTILKDRKEKGLESVLLQEGSRIFDKSTAAIRIFAQLGSFPWRIFYVLLIIPKPIRDFFYLLIAKNRYKVFGRAESCIMPDKLMKHKFLDVEF